MRSPRHKVVLYNPAALFYTMPLPLLAVASVLDRGRYDVVVLDARTGDDLDRVLEETSDALCLGVTVHTGAPIRDSMVVSKAVSARWKIPVVWGGWYPSLFPCAPLPPDGDTGCSITIQGQGELTFMELLDRLAAGRWVEDVRGLSWMDGCGGTVNPPRPLHDVNEFPSYDYGLLDVERYFAAKGVRQLDYVASVGCRFRCAFCADPLVYGRGWYALHPARVVTELEDLWQRYHFTDLAFQDETLFTSTRWVSEVAEGFLRNGRRFTWTGTLRADQSVRMSDEVWAHCARAGLRRVLIGVESGSQQMLDWMKKDITVDQVLQAAERCRRYGIGAIFPFIVGFPGETDESVDASLSLAKRLRAMSPSFDTPVFYFKPYPGSPLADAVLEQGYSLPRSVSDWAEFEFVASSGPWVSPEKRRRVERFKFYNRFAGGPETLRRWPLQQLARWRMRRDYFGLAIEKAVVDVLKPAPDLA